MLALSALKITTIPANPNFPSNYFGYHEKVVSIKL
jgi:hypothetical protein